MKTQFVFEHAAGVTADNGAAQKSPVWADVGRGVKIHVLECDLMVDGSHDHRFTFFLDYSYGISQQKDVPSHILSLFRPESANNFTDILLLIICKVK